MNIGVKNKTYLSLEEIMVKFSAEYISRLDEKVNCDCCGKQMRLGQRIMNLKGNVCAECANSIRYIKNQKKR